MANSPRILRPAAAVAAVAAAAAAAAVLLLLQLLAENTGRHPQIPRWY